MIALRPRQEKFVEDIRVALQRHRSVLGVAPTGFGKTVVFSHLAQRVAGKGNRVHIVVHREELVDQVSRTLSDFDVPHGFIAAGRSSHPLPVMVCSVRTLEIRAHAYKPPDLLVIDEAHHTAGANTWARVVKKYPEAYILGVTATPLRLDGKDLAGTFETMVQGPTVSELIDNGDLCRYKMWTPPVALGQLRKRMGDYIKADLIKTVDKPSVTGDAVRHYQEIAPGKKALAFCVSLEHATHVRDRFRAAGYRSEQLDGKLDKTVRRKMVQDFSHGRIDVLTSCDLVSEGFDLPALEVAILLRPTASLGLYLQQVGRALRQAPGKSHAIILDHAGNARTHGLPDDDREWCLGDPEGMGIKRKTAERAKSIRTCGKCFAAAKSGTMFCGECGFEWPVEPREVKQVAGDLVEVTDVQRAKIEARREVAQSKTLDALVALEKQRGYRPGWAHHVWSSRYGR